MVKVQVVQTLARGERAVVHFPTMKTMLAVEDVIRKSQGLISKSEILRQLPTKTMRSTLTTGLDYMERRGLILNLGKGKQTAYVWVFNPNKNLARAHREGTEWKPYDWTKN